MARQVNVSFPDALYAKAVEVSGGSVAAWVRRLVEAEVGADGQPGLTERVKAITERMDKASKAHCEVLSRLKVLEQRTPVSQVTPVKELVSADDNPFAKPEDTFHDTKVVYDER